MSQPTTSPSNRRVPEFLPVRTVVKFALNPNKQAANRLFSRTLGKFAFIDEEWAGAPVLPRPGEFWFVDVVHETCHGQVAGSFLVHPIREVKETDCKRLMPGMYREHEHGRVLLLEPDIGGCAWLLPLLHRRSITRYYSVIVIQ